MEIICYNFEKRYNSTKRPTGQGVVYNVQLKDATSIYTPVFTVTNFGTEYNYIQWNNRFYYVTDVEIIRNNIYNLTCRIDILRSFYDNIANTTAFIDFSTSDYNTQIIDNRIPVATDCAYYTNSAQIVTGGTQDFNFGTYIIEYVTDSANFGATGLVALGVSDAKELSNVLTNTDFFNIENFEKQFNNVYQSIKKLTYIPMLLTNFSGPVTTIRLGSYSTGISGFTPPMTVKMSADIAIPRPFTDFRQLQPYCSYLLYLPGYGFTTLDNADIAGKNTLNIKLDIDGATGDATYTVDKIFKGSCNFGVSMSLGTVSGNIGGVWGSGLQRATSLITGNAVGAIGGLVNTALASRQRNLGNVGSTGALSSVFATIGDDWRNAYIVCIAHNTAVEPDSIAETMGRPCQKVRQINGLTGYVQTRNASVSTGNSDITQQINNLLDGGIYIE